MFCTRDFKPYTTYHFALVLPFTFIQDYQFCRIFYSFFSSLFFLSLLPFFFSFYLPSFSFTPFDIHPLFLLPFFFILGALLLILRRRVFERCEGREKSVLLIQYIHMPYMHISYMIVPYIQIPDMYRTYHHFLTLTHPVCR
jgi:hypothetical protein